MIDSKKDMFSHLNRMQRRIMTKESWITEQEFLAESAEEQEKYYNWMCRQCGDFAVYI